MGKRTQEQDKFHARGFASGTAVACAILVDVWGETVAAEEILRAAGIDTRAKAKALGVDDYDLKALAPVFKHIRDKKRRA